MSKKKRIKGGSFRLIGPGFTTDPIPFNATKKTISKAVEKAFKERLSADKLGDKR